MAVDLMQSRIAKARSGDIESAKALLEDFVVTVKAHIMPDGSPHRLATTGTDISLPWEFAKYLAECFAQILDGVAGDKALSVAPGRPGRPELSKTVTSSRDLGYVLAVLESMREYPNYSIPHHRQRIATKLKVTPRAIRAAWENVVIQMAVRLLDRMESHDPN